MGNKLNLSIVAAVVIAAVSAYLIYDTSHTPEQTGVERVAFSDLKPADIDAIIAAKQKMVPVSAAEND